MLAHLSGLLAHWNTLFLSIFQIELGRGGIHAFASMTFVFHHINMVVHGLTAHAFVKIQQCGVELRTVHAGETGLSAHRHAAGTAHARAIHHQRIETHHTGNIQFRGLLGHKLHHNHRADGRNLIVTLAFLLYQTVKHIGHIALFAHGAVIGSDVEVVGNGTQLLQIEEQRLVTRTSNHIAVETVRIHPFHQRVDRSDAHAACDEAIACATQFANRTVDERRRTAQRPHHIAERLAHLKF